MTWRGQILHHKVIWRKEQIKWNRLMKNKKSLLPTMSLVVQEKSKTDRTRRTSISTGNCRANPNQLLILAREIIQSLTHMKFNWESMLNHNFSHSTMAVLFNKAHTKRCLCFKRLITLPMAQKKGSLSAKRAPLSSSKTKTQDKDGKKPGQEWTLRDKSPHLWAKAHQCDAANK